jgi:hypothetical protein
MADLHRGEHDAVPHVQPLERGFSTRQTLPGGNCYGFFMYVVILALNQIKWRRTSVFCPCRRLFFLPDERFLSLDAAI